MLGQHRHAVATDRCAGNTSVCADESWFDLTRRRAPVATGEVAVVAALELVESPVAAARHTRAATRRTGPAVLGLAVRVAAVTALGGSASDKFSQVDSAIG